MTEAKNAARSRRAADGLIQVFEKQILDGTLRDGEPLPPEREIVQTYGVSRTVVREAVLALSNKGLVDARPRFRPVVRKPGYDAAIQAVGSVATRLLTEPGGVKSLFDLRIMMEAALVRQAAVAANKDQIAKLKAALAANEAAIAESETFYQTDVAFHGVLYEIPGNPLLPSIHRAYTSWLSSHWKKMPRLPDRNRANFEAHARIFDAILLRDPDAAEEALRAHLAAAWQQVRRTFGEI
ncbi:MAG: FadR/GntR family transcriptional regulator [Kiloniellales bacterium]|nr:FadR/GntR family transcriptional regulator [Kiloniellales bacterium]